MRIKKFVLCLFVSCICANATAQEYLNSLNNNENWIVPRQSGARNPVKVKIIPPPEFVFKRPYQFRRLNNDPINDIAHIEINTLGYFKHEKESVEKLRKMPPIAGRDIKIENIFIQDTIINQRMITLSKWEVKAKLYFSNYFTDFFAYKLFVIDSLNSFSIKARCPIDSSSLDSLILKSLLTFDYKYVPVSEITNIHIDAEMLDVKLAKFSFGGKSDIVTYTSNGDWLPSPPEFTKIEIDESEIIDIRDLKKVETSYLSTTQIPLIGSYRFKIHEDTVDLYDEQANLINRVSADSVAYLLYKTHRSMLALPPKLIDSNPVSLDNLFGYEFVASNPYSDYYTLVLFDKSTYYIINASCSNQVQKKMTEIITMIKYSLERQ